MEKHRKLVNLHGERKIANLNEIIPEFVKELSNKLGEIYLVGGTLRDMQLGYTPFDFDFVVSDLETVKEFLNNRNIKFFVLNNDKFPFLRAVINHRTFDFIEIYNGSIEEDKNRRDFTINALYYNIKENRFIKDELALSDIKNRILRAVSKVSVGNDPIRALRAIRFIARFHLSVEKNTLLSVREGFKLLKQAQSERKNEEMRRILSISYKNVLSAFGLIFEKDTSVIAEKLSICNKFPLLHSELSKGVSYDGLCEIYLISKKFSLNRVNIFALTKKEEAFVRVLENATCNFETLFNIFIKDSIYSALASASLYCCEENAKRVEKWNEIKIDGNMLKRNYHIEGKMLGKLKNEILGKECKRIYENI